MQISSFRWFFKASDLHMRPPPMDFDADDGGAMEGDLTKSHETLKSLASTDSLAILGQNEDLEVDIRSPGLYGDLKLKDRLPSTVSEANKHHNQHWIFLGAYKIAMSRFFSTSIMIVIAFNLLMMGIEVDTTSALAPGEPTPPFFLICNVVIVVIFIFELAIKFLAYGPTNVLFGPEKWWNLFDILIVMTSVIETVLDMDTWIPPVVSRRFVFTTYDSKVS